MNKIPKNFTLQTNRFQLRCPKMKDIPVIFSASQYKGFTDGMLWFPPTQQEDLIPTIENGINAWETGDAYSFCVTHQKNDTLIARIGIRKTNTVNVWSIGFWTHPEQQKKGIMTEVLKAVLQFGFEQLNAIKIEASYAYWNKASEKVLLSSGMRFVERIKNGFKKNNLAVDEVVMAIEQENWSI